MSKNPKLQRGCSSGNDEAAPGLATDARDIKIVADEKETAETIQGLYRNIEVESRAQLARNWAFDRALKGGRGYFIEKRAVANALSGTRKRARSRRVALRVPMAGA